MKNEIDLFNRIKPALRCKRHELKANGIMNITEKDIWDYNKINTWKKAHGLTLAKMVDDILNTPQEKYIDYINTRG